MSELIWNAVILRYNEIGLKGGNRTQFEKRLADNIRFLMKRAECPMKVQRVRGRMWMHLPSNAPLTEEVWEIVRHTLPKAFGLASFSPVVMCPPDWEKLRPLCNDMILRALKSALEKTPGEVTFRLRARRADKRFPMESRTLECYLVDNLPEEGLDIARLKVDLKNADITIGIEIRDEFACVWYDEYPAAGGLPVGSNESVLTLLSGGIDSPVAAWLLMKRGCHNSFVTFDSSPYTPPESVEKVKDLVKILDQWQGQSTLWVCNIVEIQKQIRDLCSPRFRTILYRRMMMRVASGIARKKRCFALVTGEAVGQVASQTVTNMNTINDAADYVVIRPLAGSDKLETMNLARQVGTLQLSEKQVPDSCTVFAPDSPTTRASLRDIVYEESKLGDFAPLLDAVISQAEVWQPES